jgi:tetratricopeptide (TPR) repeat protein
MSDVSLDHSQAGIIGDNAHVEGGIHFHNHTTPTGLPLQRPPRVEYFTDREQALADLLDDLRSGNVVTLCGPGGIGKTALAAEAVWTLAPENEAPERFPDGILFHSFYNQPEAALALEHIATSYGREPKPNPATAALQVLAGKQALLILDGAENADDLRAVLNVRGGCGVLITSRARRDALAVRQDVEPLEAADAVELLRKWGGDRAADAEAARAICRQVGYLPLAVRLVDRYLAETGERAGEYLAWLRETPLDALDLGQRRQKSVPVLLEKSLAQVSEEACQVLGIVGALALTPFDRTPLAAALDLIPNALRKPLGELVGYGLLAREEGRYVVSHALVHTYARERLQPEVAVLQRLAGYYNDLAREQRELGLEGYRRLDLERRHLMRVLTECAAQEQWIAVHSLVSAVDDYLDIRGYWMERVQALRLGVQAARALENRRDEGAFLGNLGNAYAALGEVGRAIEYYEQALGIAREIGDRRGEAFQCWNLGLLHEESDPDRAAEFMQICVDYEQEIDHPDAAADAERVAHLRTRSQSSD